MENELSCNLICEGCPIKTRCIIHKVKIEGPSYSFSFNVMRKIEKESLMVKWGWKTMLPWGLAGLVFIYMILSYFINIPEMPSLLEYIVPKNVDNIFNEYSTISIVVSLIIGLLSSAVMIYKTKNLKKQKTIKQK